MTEASFTGGQRQDPSAWSKRLPAAVLALVGCGIATYLALYQLDILPQVWEPFFGNGSRFILKDSAVAHFLPVPDAALGALVYLIEAVAECVGDRQRWRTWPAAVFVVGVVAGGLFLTAVALVVCQVFWFRAYCTLCLASAACSLAIAGLVTPEVWAAVKFSREFGRRHEARGESGSPAVRKERSGLI